jgi:hypothetical protein
MDYLNLTQARALIPQKTSTEFMAWIVDNKLHTRGESVNLEIEKEHFYKAFNLPLESPPPFIKNPVILENQTIKQVEMIKDTPLIFNPLKNAEFEGISEVSNAGFIDEGVKAIDEYDKIIEVFNQRKLEADNYYNEKIKNADDYYAKRKAEADKYTQEITNKADADFSVKVNELHDIEVKIKEIMPIYQGLRKDMIDYKSAIETMIKGFKLRINEDVWYPKAVKYFENLNKKIEEVVKLFGRLVYLICHL